MKLLRFGDKGQEKPGILDEHGNIRDLSGLITDINGDTLSPSVLHKLAEVDLSALPLVSDQVRLGACVNGVGKFICIGLNYADHAHETGADIPAEPVVFMKATSAINGPNDPIIKPKNSSKLDWEVELAIVIGQDCRYVDENQAEQHIAGYCVCNDVSERAFQLEMGGQWDKGKGCDSFGPIGPWLVTSDEIFNVLNLSMHLSVNGKTFQQGSTQTMIFSPAYIVSYLSQFMSLQAGDVISTGTPPGVGLGQKPPLYLNVGDHIHLSIEGLGEQRQTVVNYQ
ncbi:fumarylacetoacetate hydrolase family protein [Neptunicella sp. SCSIO 80796]|uniref:fumarylacetoacetate hydrolase family protein n=1 Tax=Neptunicella plasticusilytica TaxID=3117012 RepID=UPI003A4DC06A